MSNFCIALAGNPNCGKTALFNLLTGSKQKVGNWPGVTVDKKTGLANLDCGGVEVVDLPGVYSLNNTKKNQAIDQAIAHDYLLNNKIDCIINVIDGSNLERNLYLTMQLLEFNIPIVIGINMMDIAHKRGLNIDIDKLSEQIGCPIVPLVANRKRGLKELKKIICLELKNDTNNNWFSNKKQKNNAIPYPLPDEATAIIKKIKSFIKPGAHRSNLSLAMRILEGDSLTCSYLPQEQKTEIKTLINNLEKSTGAPADLLIADQRYQHIRAIVAATCSRSKAPHRTITQRIDSIVLNRFLGIPVFLMTMYLMFVFAINIGGAFQDFFDIGSTALLVDGLSSFLMHLHFPVWLVALLTHGLGKGINTTITFIPVIGGMFLFLAFLEDSGYMARAAFVIDRLMRFLGLPGHSFVPMIVGFGCNVPAVMGARTIGNSRDRVLTIMMSPFMSCGARLAIFAVFVSVFFPHHGQNIVFLLYLLGIFIAVLTGMILRNTILPGKPAPLVMELPPYHRPQWSSIWRHAWRRLSAFLLRAGRYIIPVCMLIGLLNSISPQGSLLQGEANNRSVLSVIGRVLTPVFSPMGISEKNWPATVGLFTGVLAKEVVVGGLNTLYSQQQASADNQTNYAINQNTMQIISSGLVAAAQSIPDNLMSLPTALLNPVAASEAPHEMSNGAKQMMHLLFASQAAAFAYLIFVLLYFPCVSTMAAVKREIGTAWSWFAMLWSTTVAYAVAVFYYQLSQFFVHPQTSLFCLLLILLSSILICYGLRFTKKTLAITSYHKITN